MAFIVYRNSDREIYSAHRTMGEANNSRTLAGLAEYSRDIQDRELPMDFSPEDTWYFYTDGTISPNPPPETNTALLIEIDNMFIQLAAWRAAFDALDQSLTVNPENTQKGRAWLHWGLVGGIKVLLSSSWSNVQKIAFLQAAVQGTNDITTPAEFLANVPDVTASAPVLWVHPTTATKWDLADAITNSADVGITGLWAETPSDADIVSGAWLASLP